MARCLVICLLAAPPAAAQLPDDVEVGAYVEVVGAMRSGGGLVAEAVGIQALASVHDRVRGIVESVSADERSLVVAGVPMRLESGAGLTDALGHPLALSVLRSGQGVDVRGRYVGGEFTARALALVGGASTNGRVKLQGTIDAVDTEAGAFRLLGVGVRMTPGTRIELD